MLGIHRTTQREESGASGRAVNYREAVALALVDFKQPVDQSGNYTTRC